MTQCASKNANVTRSVCKVNFFVGLLSPYAFHHTGFGFGICLLTLVGYITYFSVNTLVSSGHRVRGYSYEEVMEAAFGVRGVLLVVFCQFCIAFGAMLAYIVVIGDTMTELIRSFDEGNALVNIYQRFP